MKRGVVDWAVRCLLALLVALGVVCVFADSISIDSQDAEVLGWTRQAVMVGPHDEIIDPSGQVVSSAETASLDAAAHEATVLAEATVTASTNATAYLTSNTNRMARYCKGLSIAVAPELDRENFCGFVVKESTDGATDTQWVWYNRSMNQQPVRWVTYTGDTQTNAVKVTWVDWAAAGTNITVGTQTWNGCHRCTVARPSWAVNVPCVTLPNEVLGGPSGFDIGDCNLTVDSKVPFTGYATNTAYKVIEYYDCGVLMERVSYE